jgi:hypothetical protein
LEDIGVEVKLFSCFCLSSKPLAAAEQKRMRRILMIIAWFFRVKGFPFLLLFCWMDTTCLMLLAQ